MIMKPHAPSELREQAIALRRAGRSRREIKELLGIGSNQTLNEALGGEPPLPSTWRPNAKDDLRAKARELRSQGLAQSEDRPEEHRRGLPRLPEH